MKYRPEIDGLRALAVLSVAVFHFFPQTLQFGFNGHLGVDIFFVISGFLIGKYIIKELNKDKFSFKQFYWRRVKRILPAAFTTLIVTTIASIIILTPYDLAAYFKSQLAAISFTPNIYFLAGRRIFWRFRLTKAIVALLVTRYRGAVLFIFSTYVVPYI